jgi:hypothetical protein
MCCWSLVWLLLAYCSRSLLPLMVLHLLLLDMAIPDLLLQVIAPRLLLPHVTPHLFCYSTLLFPCVAPCLLLPHIAIHILDPYSPLAVLHPGPRLLFLLFFSKVHLAPHVVAPPCVPTRHGCSPFVCCCSLLMFPRMVLPPPLFLLQVVFGATTNK